MKDLFRTKRGLYARVLSFTPIMSTQGSLVYVAAIASSRDMLANSPFLGLYTENNFAKKKHSAFSCLGVLGGLGVLSPVPKTRGDVHDYDLTLYNPWLDAKVDDPILVKGGNYAHFSHYEESEGLVYFFNQGKTSFSGKFTSCTLEERVQYVGPQGTKHPEFAELLRASKFDEDDVNDDEDEDEEDDDEE